MDEMYYVPFADVKKFWDRMKAGGRKSFTYDEIDKNWKIRSHRDMYVHYLKPYPLIPSQRENKKGEDPEIRSYEKSRNTLTRKIRTFIIRTTLMNYHSTMIKQ